MKVDVFEQQNFLQQQAIEVLQQLDLIDILSKHGEVKIVGSVALGLMTWPDIDVDLESSDAINVEEYFEMVRDIFSKQHIKQLMLIDNRNAFEKNRPQSMYLGIIYDLDGVDWKIDIRYVNPSAAWAGDDLERIKSKLTKEHAKAILEIKSAVHDHPKYRKEFSGHDIYQAVLENDVVSVESFRSLLQTRGILV